MIQQLQGDCRDVLPTLAADSVLPPAEPPEDQRMADLFAEPAQ